MLASRKERSRSGKRRTSVLERDPQKPPPPELSGRLGLVKVILGAVAGVLFFIAAGMLSDPDTANPPRFFLYGMGFLALSLAIPERWIRKL
jgi:hypothetical protein